MDSEKGRSIYTIEYFKKLGFTKNEAAAFVKSWNRDKPQTPEEIRRGIMTERENREAAVAAEKYIDLNER